MTTVVALGGHALWGPSDGGDHRVRVQRACESARGLAALCTTARAPLVVVHGNGPQVGQELLRMEAAAAEVPPLPLHACVAATQGEIGHALAAAFRAELVTPEGSPRVVCLMTTVEVDQGGTAAKPIGPVYSAEAAATLRNERGWDLREDRGRGLRRYVPSPRPVRIVELDAVRSLLATHDVVLAGGGGGVPTIMEDGVWVAIDAVVDKDFTAALLASELGVDRLIHVTAVDAVYRDFATDRAFAFDRLGAAEARRLLAAGEFAPGTMGPKIEASLEFLERGGAEVLITDLEGLEGALGGRGGTRLVRR